MKIGKTLYFDHQATTPVDARVFGRHDSLSRGIIRQSPFLGS